MSSALSFSSFCPVCNCSIRHAEEQPDAFDKSGGDAYLLPLANSLGISLEEIYASISVFRCSNCGAVFFNPWFNHLARNCIFLEGHPIHNVGWRNLQERFEQNLRPSLQMPLGALLEVVQERIGRIETYAELGCPFQGLLLHFANNTKVSALGQSASVFTSMRAEDYRRFLPPLRQFMRTAGLSKVWSRRLSLVRQWRNKFRGRWRQNSTDYDSLGLKRTFIPLQSSKFWGLNCSMYGDSCAATAHRCLDAAVLPQALFMESDFCYDLIGLFNVLDHQDDPLKLLRQCLSKGRAVLCLGHESPISAQHHFGLGRSFFQLLDRTLGQCSVEELSHPESQTNLYLLTPKDPLRKSE